jgi:hypothetical protein
MRYRNALRDFDATTRKLVFGLGMFALFAHPQIYCLVPSQMIIHHLCLNFALALEMDFSRQWERCRFVVECS